ncbi:MAG: hypothetical protein NQU41_06260, partial [Candidatus Methanosuratincola sp.]|nr:hypothetical protein [Candidatus Methanosuratincola sp.]
GGQHPRYLGRDLPPERQQPAVVVLDLENRIREPLARPAAYDVKVVERRGPDFLVAPFPEDFPEPALDDQVGSGFLRPKVPESPRRLEPCELNSSFPSCSL